MKNKYNSDYYERGKELGISGYSNYRWLPNLTIPMCEKIISHLGITKEHLILDFGCAKGFVVKAFKDLGYQCFGTDISEYALSKSPDDIKENLNFYQGDKSLSELLSKTDIDKFDFIISKDVFEHIPYDEIEEIIFTLSKYCRKLFCVMPLGKDGKYIVPDYENDITHIIREDINWWKAIFERCNFKIIKQSYLLDGVKDNWKQYEKGNGFFILESN
tara:strand:+ start:529 stop:1179 length:651 start_codon:yes stop_codon:yes gene_type:complete